MRFEVRVPLTQEFVRWVLSSGRRVTVLAPDALREAALDEARGKVRRDSRAG